DQCAVPALQTRINPEQEAMLAESVGLALLVVMEKLTPAERLAFVLHDMFGVSFEDIAEMIDRTPVATRQLASRARRRVQGVEVAASASLSQQRAVVEAFLAALRAGDMQGILAVLDPNVVRRADPGAAASAPREIHGAIAVTEEALKNVARAQLAQVVLIDGAVGVIVAPQGKLRIALSCRVEGEKIVEFEVIGDPARLSRLDIALLPD
ncbi:MAG TPA: sigma factor-like helix-turn-helix DNA-binding protein, partial [Edaphobacter sp.]|nr:sigma factor-like helix-turn-helix DNA-binding protein [Edaphobacter sp.]